eukprot:130398_1
MWLWYLRFFFVFFNDIMCQRGVAIREGCVCVANAPQPLFLVAQINVWLIIIKNVLLIIQVIVVLMSFDTHGLRTPATILCFLSLQGFLVIYNTMCPRGVAVLLI